MARSESSPAFRVSLGANDFVGIGHKAAALALTDAGF